MVGTIKFPSLFKFRTYCFVIRDFVIITDGEQDPAPKFFSSQVQVLLKRLTRPDFAKVFRKRTSSGLQVLKTPTYKFLTNEELEAEIARTKRKANRLLQMPPVVKVNIFLFLKT